ncbi:hypothetical protein N7470_008772 [Penicillium chermesinum]|nr:hypothetical protein N7470_008772 [Penicillium chermesinum]
MWETLYRYFPEVRKVIRSSAIDEIQNGLTLQGTMHYAFGHFQCTFEPVVTFVDPTEPEWGSKLPSRILLDCHYRLTKLFDASGIGEAIDKSLDSLKELKTGSVLDRATTDVGSLIRFSVWESNTT